MSLFHLAFLVGVCVAVLGVALAMLNDVWNELDRRQRNDEIAAATRRHLRQRAVVQRAR